MMDCWKSIHASDRHGQQSQSFHEMQKQNFSFMFSNESQPISNSKYFLKTTKTCITISCHTFTCSLAQYKPTHTISLY